MVKILIPNQSEERQVLRLANQDDLPFLREMMFEAAHWDPAKPRPGIDEGLADPTVSSYLEGWVRPGDGGLIATEDESNQPVAAAWYRLFTAEHPGYAFVDEETPQLMIAVAEAFRGKHLGTGLMAGLKRLGQAQGHRRLSLAVHPHNLRARLLYAKMGFREVRNDGETIVMVGNVDTVSPAGMN